MKTRSMWIALALVVTTVCFVPVPGPVTRGPWGHTLFSAGGSAASLYEQTQVRADNLSEHGSEIADDSSDQRELVEHRKEWERWFFEQRAFPFGAIPVGARERALAYAQRNMRAGSLWTESAYVAEGVWEPIGPASIPNGNTPGGSAPVSGRVTALAIDPSDPRTIYLGSAQGGVWKSIDSGATWTPLGDSQPSLAIGCLAIDPSDPRIIYAGTGEGNLAYGSYFGAGVLKSMDAGASWILLGASTLSGLAITDLIIDPTNTQTLYAGAILGFGGIGGEVLPGVGGRGVYKSTDGGITWRRLTGGLPSGTTTGVQDLAMDPTNPQVIYATFNRVGIFRTLDGGSTWIRLGGTGFPNGGFSRIAIAVAPTSGSTIYAALEDSVSTELLNLFRSTDGGARWTTLARPPAGARLCQCFFDNIMAVSPRDPNTVFFGGVGFWRSTSGGTSWSYLSFSSKIHVDVHAIAFDPSNPSRVFVGNDGGVWASSNAGGSWTNLNTNLSITQFNYIAAHPTDVTTVYGGTQDNGTLKYSGTPTWMLSQTGDGGAALVDFSNPNTVYHTFTGVTVERSDDAGTSWSRKMTGLGSVDRSLFYVPLAMDPSNSRTIYLGSFLVYKTSTRGDAWFPISPDLTNGFGAISAIAVAPTSASTIYVGTSDGNLQVTTNGGATWNLLTSGLPRRYISHIVVDPTDARIALVSLSGFRAGHVFRTTNGAMTWTDISGNLPDIPANAMLLDRSTPAKLYVGTDIGVFVNLNGDALWADIESGLPNTVVFDLQINEKTNSLFAATYGRGVFKLAPASIRNKLTRDRE